MARCSANSIVNPPGRDVVAHAGDGEKQPTSVLVWAIQEESTDDGGSQSPLGALRTQSLVGNPRHRIRCSRGHRFPRSTDAMGTFAQKLQRQGWADRLLPCGAYQWRTVSPSHQGLPHRLGHGPTQHPGFYGRAECLPLTTDSFFAADYRALLSDSEMGDTYGLIGPLATRVLDRSTRLAFFYGPRIGNGPVGLGWTVSAPAVSHNKFGSRRSSRRGLPASVSALDGRAEQLNGTFVEVERPQHPRPWHPPTDRRIFASAARS